MLSIQYLLDPQSIAVVGASQQVERGSSVLANPQQSGYRGTLLAINPRYSVVRGVPSLGRRAAAGA